MYIRKDAKSGVLSIENVDFIRIDGQNMVPKMGIYLHISAELQSQIVEINVICVHKQDCNRLW